MLVFLNVGKAVGTSEPEEHAVILPLELMARDFLTELSSRDKWVAGTYHSF